MQFELYISTFRNDSSIIFSSCEESKLPIKVSSLTSVKPQENQCFNQKIIDGFLVVVYEIKNAGKTNVRGYVRRFDENRYAISNEPVCGLLDDESFNNICEYLKNIKNEEFNNLTKYNFEVKYSKVIEDKAANKTITENSSNTDKAKIDDSSSSHKNGIFRKIAFVSLFLFLFFIVSVSIFGANLFTKVKNKVVKAINRLTSIKETNKSVFAKVNTLPKYYDEFVSILNNRELDYEKLFKEVSNNHLKDYSEQDKETIKYFVAYYSLVYMDKAYDKENINENMPNNIFTIIIKNNSSNVEKDLEKGNDLTEKVKFDYSKFKIIEEILNKNYEIKIGNTLDLKNKFNNIKRYKMFLFLPSVKEMESVKEINPQYFSIKGKIQCEKWEDFPKVFGFEDEKDMIEKREYWFKIFIEEILNEIKNKSGYNNER